MKCEFNFLAYVTNYRLFTTRM